MQFLHCCWWVLCRKDLPSGVHCLSVGCLQWDWDEDGCKVAKPNDSGSGIDFGDD